MHHCVMLFTAIYC